MPVKNHSVLWYCLALFALSVKALPLDGFNKILTYPLPDVALTPDGLTRVSLTECEPDVQTGRPVLPVTGVPFEIPAGFEVASVTLTPGPIREIPLAALVQWGLPPVQPGEPLPAVLPDPAIYQAADPYPDYASPVWRTDSLRENTLLSVQVHPVRFDPARQLLLAATSVTVSVGLRPAPSPLLPQRGVLATTLASSPLSPGESHTYVIISTSNLLNNAPAPWNFQTLCASRARAGFTPATVTTEWISSNYAGPNQAAKIRAFVQDAYHTWGLRYLLLGGTFNLLPVQKLSVAFTDFSFPRSTEIPADAIYYGCMEGSYDNNGNGRYGEVHDGLNGGDVDLTAEVMVGRFPVANTAELAHMVRKTLRYEAATPQDLAPNALVAEKMDMGTLVYGTGYMEELRWGSAADALKSLGFETSPYAEAFDTDHTLYDSDARLWTTANALAFLNQSFQTVNHIGHGAIQQCMKISLAQTANQTALRAFTNDMPYFIYSQTCSAGAFDSPDCFAEQIVTVSNAACSAIMNAREGWEYNNVVGGYSHRFHRCFWDAALRGSATRFGEINEQSRRMNLFLLSSYSANYWRWVYYELNLFGDPATPFAAAVNMTLPVISHTPLINTFDTQTLYRVACSLEPIGIYDPDTVRLVWQTDREPGVVHTQAVAQVEGNLFEGFIDPQPAKTRITYALYACNHAGYQARWPETGESAFDVTRRLDLDIRGSPFDFGTATPDYGTHHFASGLVAEASVSDFHMIDDATRYRSTGFFGTGSAPQSGTNRTVAFRMDTSSLLVWTWQCEHLLTLCSDNSAFPTQTFWVSENSLFLVPPVPQTASNGSEYAFAEWRLDGARTPAAPGYCSPAFGDLPMDTPHTLEARYLPATLDSDNNGIPDWWEFRYFGTTGNDPLSDRDSDGYTLLEEYQDRSNPLVTSSLPAPPLITHTPLAETQTHPGPLVIQAIITDTHEVGTAAVRWHRRDEAWQLTPMLLVSNTLYEATIGTLSGPGDDFEYQLLASDPSGFSSQTDLFFFFLKYPVADSSRFHDLAFVSLPTQAIVSQYMNLYNTGNADLVWTMRFARVENILSTNLPCWDRTSLGQAWQVSTNRSASAPFALFSHLVSNAKMNVPVRSTITMPPVLIGPDATLSFNYWIFSEVHNNTTRAFDGGIVEYSTDYGATYQQLKGPYTHTIYGWEASPWPDGTPCLAGKGTEGWRTITFDLLKEYPEMNGFQGRVLYFRFHYGGDNNTDNEGWYVDDVTVTPLQWQQGFSNSIESTYNYTVPAGDYKRILWCNLPTSMDVRDDNVTVFLASNDPVNPLFSFYWQIKLRDYPLLPGLSAAQTTTGDGLVSLAAGVYDTDGEPVTIAVQWSPDSGKTWSAATLTSILTSAGSVSSNAPDGVIADIPTFSGSAPITNRLDATWSSRIVTPPITVNTQVLFRVSATNGYFGRTYTSARLTVDNVPPSFLPGTLALAPLSTVGPYALTTNLLTLTWPAATDTTATGPLTYRLTDSVSLTTGLLSLTSTTLAVSNRLNTIHTYQVEALDPAGNVSLPLTFSSLVLDALGDYDVDGMNNANEETAGTLSTDPASRFTVAMQPVSGKPGILALVWNSSAGRRYTIEATSTLLPPAWQPLPGYTDIPGTGAALTIELPRELTSQFFRLRVQKP